MAQWQLGVGQLMQRVLGSALLLALWRTAGVIGLVWLAIMGGVFLSIRRRHPGEPVEITFMKSLAAYFLASLITLPFINQVWAGPIPILALFQYPKLSRAEWVSAWLVHDVIGPLGLSRGSASPDLIMTIPYAIILTYTGIIVAVLGFVAVRTRTRFQFQR